MKPIKLFRSIFPNMVLVYFLVLMSCKSGIDNHSYMIKKGEFNSILTETGELQAVNARILTMPYIGWRYGWNFKVTGLMDHGTLVNQGDSIAQFDGASVKNYLFERMNRLEVEKVTLNKLMVEQQIRLKSLESQIESSKASFNLKKLQVEKFKFESERKKAVKQKELEKAEIELRKAQDTYEFTKSIIENELKIQHIKIRQLENDIADAEAALLKLTITSPINGMVQILENGRTRNSFQMGDDVYQGQPFISVPDLSQMKIKSSVNEDDFFKVSIGQKVIVRLDAYPLKEFKGEIQDIAKLSHKKDAKSPIKVFDIIILIEDSDPILKPGMTVSCDIYTSEFQDVYYVENECIFKDTLNTYLMIENGEKTHKCLVNLGPANSKYTVINGQIEEGWKAVPRNKINHSKT